MRKTIPSAASKFWQTSGYFLLERTPEERLQITDEFLRAIFLRPELRPPDDACAAERALHSRLLEDPQSNVSELELASLTDPDAADNYQVVLKFRDHLIKSGTLETAYLSLFQQGRIVVPPLFIDQLVHAILRGILDGAGHAFQARAAELFFRSQRISVEEGQIMAADEETIEHLAETGGMGSLGRMLVQSEIAPVSIDLDVLNEESEGAYWGRSDRFDYVLDLTFGRPGLDALCRVVEKWIHHFRQLEVRVHPVQSIRDERWRWHCGLDAQSTQILNALYRGEEPDEDVLQRLLSLFRLTTKDPTAFIPEMAGRPVYLALAMNEQKQVRLKPQNLLINLPLANPS
ncbi:MAG: DUF6352 family protein [Kiloniellales bacterium]|nr:DUF6352 family protein [Kiloniellales bacterium]